MGPADVLNLQVELIDSAQHGILRTLARSYDDSENSPVLREGLRRLGEPDRPSVRGPRRVEILADLPSTPAYFVTAEMTAVAEAAGVSLESEALAPDEVPSPIGFIVFDQPIAVLELGETESERWPLIAAVWRVWENEVRLLLFGDRDEISASSPPASGEETPLPRLLFQQMWELPFGEPFHHDSGGDAAAGQIDRALRNIWSAWLLIGQKITMATAVGDAARPVRRRAQRAGVTPTVTVIELRAVDRQPPPQSERRSVEWQARWVVRPHYRRQWYPSERTHRRILVGPYVKGPADKPIKPAAVVRALRR